MSDQLKKGLRNVLVTESEISHIDGDAGELIYRGYDIQELARETTFEEVIYLLWEGTLPTRDELAAFSDSIAAERHIDDGTRETLAKLAEEDEQPMAALRSGVSTLSAYDPETDAEHEDREATKRKGRRIAAKIPTILATYDLYRRGEDPIEPREDLSHAANFLYMLTGEEPDPVAEETFGMALILHADLASTPLRSLP